MQENQSHIISNSLNTPRLAPNPELERTSVARLLHAPFALSREQRQVVGTLVRAHCELRRWNLHACNVRTNHVHIVCSAPVPPEKLMGELKAWASRRLRERDAEPVKIWTRHGSTRWIDSDASFQRAVEYVNNER